MLEYLCWNFIGEMLIILASNNICNSINNIDTTIQLALPDHELSINNLNKISPIDDHLTYGVQQR